MLKALSCKIDYTKDLLYTDHKPLKWLFNHKDPSSKLQRWRLKLEEYDYEIIYKKGKINSTADALSRYPVNAILPTENPNNIPNPQDITLDSGLMDILVTPPSFNPDDAFTSPIPMETTSHPEIQIDNISDSPIDPQKVLDEFLNLESQPDTGIPTNSETDQLTIPEFPEISNIDSPITQDSDQSEPLIQELFNGNYSQFSKLTKSKTFESNAKILESNSSIIKSSEKVPACNMASNSALAIFNLSGANLRGEPDTGGPGVVRMWWTVLCLGVRCVP
ncbi:unnamed protein product [Pieris brassicae]|uniref:Reverse transcriptase RNase H-like domain-containing protein n=1 Tax=Pieris brassicae TaxID=7116 RepID=A0A9P0T4W2_PIEBR|nr:unnamed protein product [Pieris brassicae]